MVSSGVARLWACATLSVRGAVCRAPLPARCCSARCRPAQTWGVPPARDRVAAAAPCTPHRPLRLWAWGVTSGGHERAAQSEARGPATGAGLCMAAVRACVQADLRTVRAPARCGARRRALPGPEVAAELISCSARDRRARALHLPLQPSPAPPTEGSLLGVDSAAWALAGRPPRTRHGRSSARQASAGRAAARGPLRARSCVSRAPLLGVVRAGGSDGAALAWEAPPSPA